MQQQGDWQIVKNSPIFLNVAQAVANKKCNFFQCIGHPDVASPGSFICSIWKSKTLHQNTFETLKCIQLTMFWNCLLG